MFSKTLVDTQTIEVAQSYNATIIPLHDTRKLFTKSYSVQLNVTVSTPSAGTFTAAVTDICTKTAHGFKTGLKVQLTTTGVLPAGLALLTDYYVIVLTANTFKLADSLAHANAGTAVDITTTGTGTHTITPTALAGCNFKFQGSNDGVNFIDLASATNITVSANFLVEKVDPSFDFLQIVYTLTAGQIKVTQITSLKGVA